jgi:hypothetical protein
MSFLRKLFSSAPAPAEPVVPEQAVSSLYMYGPDADRLFAAVRPVLETAAFMRGARVKLRYGPAGSGAEARTVVLGAT